MMTCIIVRQQTVKVNEEGEIGWKLVVATGGTSIKSIKCVLKYLVVKINIEVMLMHRLYVKPEGLVT